MSLKRAAAELHVTPAAVSHQIKALEEYLGVKLFERFNRRLQLTAAARAGLPKLNAGFDMLAQAVAQMRPRDDSALLMVTVAPSFAARWLMPRLHRFFAAHPDVEVRVSARTRMLGRNTQLSPERATVERWLEESDVGIIYGHGDYPGLRVDKLLPLTIAPICSPELLKGEHPLRNAQDLQHHTLVHDDTGVMYDNMSFWDVWLEASGVQGIDTNRGSHFSQPVLAIEAADDHLGVVATFPVLASAEISAGRLVLPFDLQVPLRSAYYLVSDMTAAERPVVAAFREWLLTEAAADAQPPQTGRTRGRG